MINKMKSMQSKTKLLLSVAIILIVASFASLALTYSGNDVKTETIKLNSIVCNTCVDKLNTVIGSIDGVSKVDISLTEKQAIVTFDDSKTSLDKIENAITSAGYNANDKTADKDAFDKLPACCQAKEKSGCKGKDEMNMNDSKENSGCKDKNMNDSKDHPCCNKSKCTGKSN
jgi:copper ion binding protein